jgi:hypothetical protein
MLSAPIEAGGAGGDVDPQGQPTLGGSIHIEIPDKAMISVERGADPVLLLSILESLRK